MHSANSPLNPSTQPEFRRRQLIKASGDEPAFEEIDACSEDGAHRLADYLRAYWRARGADVFITIQRIATRDDRVRSIWTIKSNMVGGLPTSIAGRAK